MIRRASLLPVLGVVALAACSDQSTTPTAPLNVRAPRAVVAPSDDDPTAGNYLVRFKGNGVPSGFAAQVAALGGEVIFAHAGVGIAAVAGLDSAGASRLAATSGVAAVDADAYTVPGETVAADAVASFESATAATPDSPANPATAAFFARQWNMLAIHATEAWAAGKLGSATTEVGIVDTGIDYLHPDLVGRVDLALSRSFLSAAENARVPAGAPQWVDLHYHGTHVAATVASNGLLAAGVTSKTRLVALRVCTPGTSRNNFTASCPTSSVLNAVLYAADNHIPVINLSLGGNFLRRDASAKGGFGPSFIATINSVYNYAYRNGTTVVVAAGNDALDLDHDGNNFNAYCYAPHVICASATGPTGGTSYASLQNVDALSYYSNFGRSAITVAAPGGNFVPVWAACSGFTLYPPLAPCRTRFYNTATGAWSAYAIGLSGTSMASPHTAGVAALAVAGGATTPDAVRARVIETADDLGQPGTDPAYGKGRVNAARASGL